MGWYKCLPWGLNAPNKRGKVIETIKLLEKTLVSVSCDAIVCKSSIHKNHKTAVARLIPVANIQQRPSISLYDTHQCHEHREGRPPRNTVQTSISRKITAYTYQYHLQWMGRGLPRGNTPCQKGKYPETRQRCEPWCRQGSNFHTRNQTKQSKRQRVKRTMQSPSSTKILPWVGKLSGEDCDARRYLSCTPQGGQRQS